MMPQFLSVLGSGWDPSSVESASLHMTGALKPGHVVTFAQEQAFLRVTSHDG